MKFEDLREAGELIKQLQDWSMATALLDQGDAVLRDQFGTHSFFRYIPEGTKADPLLLDALKAFAARHHAACIDALHALGVCRR